MIYSGNRYSIVASRPKTALLHVLGTDCKDLIIDPNTPVPYPYANAYLKFHFLQRSQLHSSTISTCNDGLAGKPFINHVRLHLPRTGSGHEGVHDAVQPAWNDSGAVFEQTAEALRYALLDAHRFHRHGLR